MTPTGPVLEVHLEEFGQHSWVKSVLNVIGGSSGSAQFRFVARPAGPDRGEGDHVLGATFPIMRMQDPGNRTEPNAWLEIAEERLEELERQLASAGWSRLPGDGPHWWSRRYTRSTGAGPRPD
ncbi:MAG: hypothetical protein ABWX84_03220 [Nocardioides sp.]